MAKTLNVSSAPAFEKNILIQTALPTKWLLFKF